MNYFIYTWNFASISLYRELYTATLNGSCNNISFLSRSNICYYYSENAPKQEIIFRLYRKENVNNEH